jgi:hypothetical protein
MLSNIIINIVNKIIIKMIDFLKIWFIFAEKRKLDIQ